MLNRKATEATTNKQANSHLTERKKHRSYIIWKLETIEAAEQRYRFIMPSYHSSVTTRAKPNPEASSDQLVSRGYRPDTRKWRKPNKRLINGDRLTKPSRRCPLIGVGTKDCHFR